MYIRPNSHIRKPKEKHVAVQLDYMMVYTHTVSLFLTHTHTHTFSFWFWETSKKTHFCPVKEFYAGRKINVHL